LEQTYKATVDALNGLITSAAIAGHARSDIEAGDVLLALCGVWDLPDTPESHTQTDRVVQLLLDGLSAVQPPPPPPPSGAPPPQPPGPTTPRQRGCPPNTRSPPRPASADHPARSRGAPYGRLAPQRPSRPGHMPLPPRSRSGRAVPTWGPRRQSLARLRDKRVFAQSRPVGVSSSPPSLKSQKRDRARR
jgi:hypothetical protein